ncbi:hypothetical protein, partial [Leptospira sp. P2653]|uniref:hypothetical protein n=1 Tax=Leptospira sp. P2653 TaxID=1218600 RepID=UPI001E64F1F0
MISGLQLASTYIFWPVLLSLTASPNTYICLSLFSISSPSWETHSLGSDSSRHSLLPFALSLSKGAFCFSRYVMISFESAFY